MLDDLRNDAASPDFFEDEDTDLFDELEEVSPVAQKAPFLGMTAFQRFILSTMLLFSVCLLGSLCLLITQRLVPPGLY